jgi:site-specific DNA-methyltransferase (adenine-specific)
VKRYPIFYKDKINLIVEYCMFYNEECVEGSKKHIADESIDLGIYDPPFGIDEKSFDKHYNRKKENVIDGYVEAPEDYFDFSKRWIEQASRILKPTGSMYIISGWSKSDMIGSAIRELKLHIRNKIIWNFNFGVFTKKKYVTSHYEIFHVVKNKKNLPIFNTFCRHGMQEKDDQNKSILYKDLSSVWMINKEYHAKQSKNQNKLPEELVRKMILYSSNVGDKVCDFFLGNFTTAVVCKKTGRIPVGFEMNSSQFAEKVKLVEEAQQEELPVIENISPCNQGKKITQDEIMEICSYINENINIKSKKKIIQDLQEGYGRGEFSIKNIVNKYCDQCHREGNSDSTDMFENGSY